jgi:WD40 repeat protein
MPLKTHCPHCNVGLVVKESKLHKNVRCPGCQQPFRVEDFHVSDSDTIARQEATETLSEPATQDTQARSQQTIGRFQLQSLLGHGAFGNVYRAYDPVLERHVALKVPRRRFVQGDRGKALLDEARAAAGLRHPHIVSVFDVGTDNEAAWIATEFVDGEPLSEQVGPDMPADKAAAIVRDLATALHYAHSEHLVHRDVKPANVMIDKSERAQLMDFGLAQQLVRDTQAAGVAGTPAYMAPEQARGEQAEPVSDQYSLGVVLFELLTGQRPFKGDANHVMLQQAETPPPAPRSIRADIPVDLQKICLKAMSKSAGDRYESCEAMATDLQRWLNGDIPLAANPSIFRQVAHWSKQRPGLAGIAFGAAGLLIAVSGFSIVWGRNTVATVTERIVEVERQLVASEASNEELAEQQRELTEDIEYQTINLTLSQKVLQYAGSIQRGYDLWERNRLAEARRLLDATPHDLRDWEYAFVSKLVEGSDRTWRGHSDPVVAVAASQDGRYVASVSGQDSSVLRLWNGFTGAMLLEVSAAEPGVDLLEFSGDGEWLAAAPAHPSSTQRQSAQSALQNGQQASNAVAQALLVRTSTRSIVQRVPLQQRPLAMGVKSDGPELIAVFEDSIGVHEIPSGKPIRQIRTVADSSHIPPSPTPPGAPVPDVSVTNDKPAFSAWPFTAGFVTPDGRHAGGVGEGKLLCWMTETGEQVDLVGVPEDIGFISQLTMSRVAKRNDNDPRNFAEWAYVSAPGQFRMGSSGFYSDTSPPHAVRGDVNHLETDFQKSVAVSGSSLSIWPKYDTTNERALLGHIGAVHQSDLISESSRLVSGGEDGTVRLWTRLGGDARFQTRPGLDGAFSGDGDTIAVARMTTRSERDSKTGRWTARTLSGFVDAREPEEGGRELEAVQGGAIATAVDYSNDGLTIAIGDATGQITLVNSETGDPIRTIETQQDAAIDGICFGRVIASHAESDTRIRIWHADDGELIGGHHIAGRQRRVL